MKIIQPFKAALGAAAVAALLGLVGCGGGGDGGISGTGIAAFSVTDAPACGYDQVNITIEKVRVNKDADASDSDPSGWSEVVLNPPKRVDLLTLTNGKMEFLGQVSLPAGTYSQMRLVLATNPKSKKPNQLLPNSVVPTGGVETALTTPSAQQSGLKVKVNLDIPVGQKVDFAIDFDACKSIVKRGNSGEYNLKPVISVVPMLAPAGERVVGYVDPAIAFTSTGVSVQQNGVPIKATVPDTSGKFVLYPVPAGSYDLVVSAKGRVTAVMTGVPVVDTSTTSVNSTSTAILPSVAATTTTVPGTVTPATATVRALQTLTGGGPKIEVAWGSVDADSGAFQIALPKGAPVKAAYVASPALPVFSPDIGAAGLYQLEARSAGGAVQTQDIDTAGAIPVIVFSFP